MFKKTCAVDTETRLLDRGIDLAPELACITYCSNEDHTPGIAIGDQARRVWTGILQDPTYTITGANFAGFDTHVLMRAFPETTQLVYDALDANRVEDVQNAEKLIDLARGDVGGKKSYTLAALHEQYGHGFLAKQDTWRLRYGELIGLPLEQWPQEATQYAKDDAAATLRVWESQQAHVQWLADSPAQSRTSCALQRVSIRGMITDEPFVRAYIAEVEQLVQRSEATLLKAGLVRENGSKDTKRAKVAMLAACAEIGVAPKITKTGLEKGCSLQEAIDKGYISLDEEACREVPHSELMQAYHTFTAADGILTRANALLDGCFGLPLQTQYLSLMSNNRTSSRIPKDPIKGVNVQNLPRVGKLRECFIPRPGYCFLSVDFSADEVACFAQAETLLTGKSKLGEALRNGIDVHTDFAAYMLGCSYDEAIKNKKDPKVKRERQNAKAANFGFLGAMGAETMMIQANRKVSKPEDKITLETAEKLKKLWYERWQPHEYFKAVSDALGNEFNGRCTVRQLFSGRVRGGLSYTQAANILFSGLACDGNTDALYQVVKASHLATWRKDVSSPFFDCHVVNFLHDEVMVEIPLSAATAAAKAITQLMIDTKKRTWMPDVPVNAEPAIMSRWVKAAEPLWSPEGELLLWDKHAL